MTESNSNEIKVRDRVITSRRLIAAVGSLLAREGFTGIGVNAVAREAGVDKKLIYRYFNGLPGLIAAFGREGDFWPSIREMAGGDERAFSEYPLEKRLAIFSSQFVRALRKRPLTLKIMAWEMVASNELTRELETVREQRSLEFVDLFFKEGGPSLKTVIMLAGAALSYLLIRSDHIDVYGGLMIGSDEGWAQIQSGIEHMIRGMAGDR